MRKLMAVLALVGMAASSQAATGWFSDYIVLSVDGGGDQYYWVGSDPSYGTQFDGANLGSLISLNFGADFKYWSDTQDRGGGAFYWSIDGGSFTEQIWTQNAIGGNDFQGTLPSSTINVAQGLSLGLHTVSVYSKSWDTGAGQGDSYLSNGGNNYTATFTVVPEPATMALFGLGVLGVVAYRSRQA